MSLDDPYEIVDPILMPWAKRHGIHVAKLYRDDFVRSIFVFDNGGNLRAQMWLEIVDTRGDVMVVASALDSSSPTGWGPREERGATLATLENVLEELRPIVFGWGGLGAFS